MIRTVTAAMALVLACTCTPASEPPAEEYSVTAAEPAIGFITENPEMPAGTEGVWRDNDGRPYTYALLGEPLPPLYGTMYNGDEFDPSVLNGWTVIDVWGLWCSDCMADAPYVAALARAIEQDPDLNFLSIHVPATAARTSAEEMYKRYGSVKAFFEEKDYSYPVLIDPDTSLRDALKIHWTPSYLLVDPEGIVRGFRTDLSKAGGEPVKDFLKSVAEVKATVTSGED